MNARKSLDGRGVDLVTHFAQRDPPIFDAREAAEFLATDPEVAAKLLSNLVVRSWLIRHHKGVYEVAPLWATRDLPFGPSRFAGLAKWVREPYYVAFRSALEIRDWLDHPVRGRIWIAVPASRHVPSTVRDKVTWVVLRPDRFQWGRERYWVSNQTIWVSDRERTILDCLHLPRHAGGVIEVAAVLVRAWTSLDRQQLAEHTDRLGIEAVRRRLGFLLESLELPGAPDLAMQLYEHRSRVRRSPTLLDPGLPVEGQIDGRWDVRVNLDPSIIAMAGRT